jgi:murein DD-endopeptidase MepM/ murein hydrolase activator NlpD
LNSDAISVDVTPQEVVPGDVVLVDVKDASPSAEAVFRKEKFTLFSRADSSLIALVPIDVHTKPDSYKLQVIDGNTTETVTIKVRPHEFRTTKLTVSEEKVTLSPENENRVAREYQLQQKIWKRISGQEWNGKFIKPIDSEISTEFGVKRIMNEKKTSIHRGTDFRGKSGTPVMSINSGKVILAEDLFYGGNTLIVDHGMGLYSVYMHLSNINASKGENVSKGQIVGRVGMSGRTTGPHLHLSVKLNGVSVNPESLFKLEL